MHYSRVKQRSIKVMMVQNFIPAQQKAFIHKMLNFKVVNYIPFCNERDKPGPGAGPATAATATTSLALFKDPEGCLCIAMSHHVSV